MSNHTSQKAINLHHTQQENARLRRLKHEYEREHRKELHRLEMKQLGIMWELFKAVFAVCVLTTLICSIIYAIRMTL